MNWFCTLLTTSTACWLRLTVQHPCSSQLPDERPLLVLLLAVEKEIVESNLICKTIVQSERNVNACTGMYYSRFLSCFWLLHPWSPSFLPCKDTALLSCLQDAPREQLPGPLPLQDSSLPPLLLPPLPITPPLSIFISFLPWPILMAALIFAVWNLPSSNAHAICLLLLTLCEVDPCSRPNPQGILVPHHKANHANSHADGHSWPHAVYQPQRLKSFGRVSLNLLIDVAEICCNAHFILQRPWLLSLLWLTVWDDHHLVLYLWHLCILWRDTAKYYTLYY